MKKVFLPLAMGLIMTGCMSPTQSETKVPDFPDSLGVSAPFAGFIDNSLLVGGGCNFPDVPVAQGGKKKFYDALYACTLNGKQAQWEKTGSLPLPLAYGVSVETPEGIVCIGGQSADGTHKEVYLVGKKGDAYTVKSLPALPVGIDNAAATLCQGIIYVTGGNQSDGGNALYALDMNKKDEWKTLSDFPGDKRIQPVLLTDGKYLYLAGGFDNTDGKSSVSTNMLKYAVDKDMWCDSIPLPAMNDGSQRACTGASGTVVQGKLVITGGVNYKIFKEAISGKAPEGYLTFPKEWYKFNDDILVFDTENRSWNVIPDIEGMAKAGGVLLQHDHHLFMVCGELKPGIRTPEIVVKAMDQLLK